VSSVLPCCSARRRCTHFRRRRRRRRRVLLLLLQTNEDEQQSVIRRIFQQVAQRPDSFCNYLEGSVPEWGDTTKIIYRHYATLYFIFAVDSQESDLGILDLIQVFVEALDKCFENVCELDLIFHSDRVHYILDEMIMAGMVLETNIHNIMASVSEQSKLHANSLRTSVLSTTALVPSGVSVPPPLLSSGEGLVGSSWSAKDIGEKFISTFSSLSSR
jgi:AP-3 complex subunit sigma